MTLAPECIYNSRLEYTKGSSSKFYQIFIFADNKVIFVWGRIGTTGQSSSHKFTTEREARSFASRKYWSKLNKGYQLRDAQATPIDPALAYTKKLAKKETRQSPKTTTTQDPIQANQSSTIPAATKRKKKNEKKEIESTPFLPASNGLEKPKRKVRI